MNDNNSRGKKIKLVCCGQCRRSGFNFWVTESGLNAVEHLGPTPENCGSAVAGYISDFLFFSSDVFFHLYRIFVRKDKNVTDPIQSRSVSATQVSAKRDGVALLKRQTIDC